MTAPMVLDGAMNADAFRAYIEQVLVPALTRDNIVPLRMFQMNGQGSVADQHLSGHTRRRQSVCFKLCR